MAGGIALDASGNAYVSGEISSPDFPTLNPYQSVLQPGCLTGGVNAFVSEFRAGTHALVYSTYLGGSNDSSSAAYGEPTVAVDGTGNIYLTGRTTSTDFPVTPNAPQGKDARRR